MIILPSSNGPHTVDGYYSLLTCYQLSPKDNTTYMSGDDGFDQYSWFIYCDQNEHSHGAMFESDRWQIIPVQTIESDDLDQDCDTCYVGISSLWTLAGILDGTPPVSMDWNAWYNYWGFPTVATSLTFTTTSKGTTECKSSTENQWLSLIHI